MNYEIELISFKLCPFVQRSLILLKEKKINYKITYIDLTDKPDWFLEISPLGKVPVLKVDGEVLFESTVINEFLDELVAPSIHPDNILLKAKQRAWVEFSSALVFDMIKWLQADSKESFVEVDRLFKGKLTQLENSISGEFFGDRFAMVDVAFAPILMRLSFVQNINSEILEEYPKIQQWSRSVLERQSVIDSLVPELESLFIGRFMNQGSYLLHSGKKE